MASKKELLLIEIREDGARVVKRNISEVGEAGDRTTGQMDKLKTVLAGLVSAKVIKDTILLADSYANMLNKLRVVTDGTWALHAAMDAVFKMSRQTRTSLEANIDMYSRIAINTKQMGLEMKDVVRFATQLNHAIILSGVTAREAQWGMVQFSQGLAAGALRGDELRSVMEQLPIVTQTLTRFLGIGRGELRKWAFEGRVTTQVIIDAFNDAEKSLAERFGRRIPTVDQAVTVLHNSLQKFVGDLDQSIQGTAGLAQVILWVSDNMDVFGKAVGIVGALLGGILLKNLIGIVAQMKLFSLAILKVNPLATAILLAGAALVVFADKIKIANDSTATLADFMTELGENAKVTYGIMRDGMTGLFEGVDIQRETTITFETILTDVAAFIDAFLGFFVGAGEVIKTIFKNIPGYAELAWNGILTGVEFVIDAIMAGFATLGQIISNFGANVSSGFNSIAAAADSLMSRNFSQARKHAADAAESLKKAATGGFTDFTTIFSEKLVEATSEDSLAGAKFSAEQAGESLGDAFGRGFEMSDFISEGVEDLFARTKAGTGDTGGPGEAGEGIFSPTPVQLQLLKDMIGDVGKVNNQMLQLQELWTAINTQQPGTEGMEATLDQVNRKMTELKIKSMEVNTDVLSGFQRGFMKLGLEISDFASMAERTIVNAFKGMEDALVSFVTTGKVNFKSLVDGMLADLTRLLARQALMGLLSSMAGGGGMGGQIAGAFGVLGGSAGSAGGGGVPTSSFGGGAGPAGRALGGPVSPGSPFLVGERGPEIFQPAQPGRIIPDPTAQEPAQEGAVTIINVSSEDEALSAMGSAEGKRIIRNEIRTYNSSGSA